MFLFQCLNTARLVITKGNNTRARPPAHTSTPYCVLVWVFRTFVTVYAGRGGEVSHHLLGHSGWGGENVNKIRGKRLSEWVVDVSKDTHASKIMNSELSRASQLLSSVFWAIFCYFLDYPSLLSL